MKLTFLVLAFFIITVASTANAQNTIKIFDAVAIAPSNGSVAWDYANSISFRTAEIYMTCPAAGMAQGTLSGPNNSNLIIDNFITVNGANVCPWNCFGGLWSSPFEMLGQPTESAYLGISPINISHRLSGSGVYRFDLMDYGDLLGSSEVHLNTNCALEAATQVCHRNNGRRDSSKTLTIGESAIAAHLAHGDTAGACADEN